VQWLKLAGPGGLVYGDGTKPLPPPINIWTLYPRKVDPMEHPVTPCCIFCDFKEGFPRKSEVKGRWAQRIARLLEGMTRREYERRYFSNENECCVVCPRYNPHQSNNDFWEKQKPFSGNSGVHRPLKPRNRRPCCQTCPSQFWLRDGDMDPSGFAATKDPNAGKSPTVVSLPP